MTNEQKSSLEKALNIHMKKSKLGSIVRAALLASFLIFLFNICCHINTLIYYISFFIVFILLYIYIRKRYVRRLKRRAIMVQNENVGVIDDIMTIINDDILIEFDLEDCIMTQRDKFLYVRTVENIQGEKIANFFFITELPSEKQRLYYKSLIRIHQRELRVVARWTFAISTLLTLFFLLSKLDLYYLLKLVYIIITHGKI